MRDWMFQVIRSIVILAIMAIFMIRLDEETRLKEWMRKHGIMRKIRHYRIYKDAYKLQQLYLVENFRSTPVLEAEIRRLENKLAPYGHREEDGFIIDPESFDQKG